MDKELILETLRDHSTELKEAGLLHLRVFGSVVRGEASFKSDIDILAEFDRSKPLTLVKVGSLESRLGEILKAKVDLAAAEWMQEPIRTQVLSEAVLAY